MPFSGREAGWASESSSVRSTHPFASLLFINRSPRVAIVSGAFSVIIISRDLSKTITQHASLFRMGDYKIEVRLPDDPPLVEAVKKDPLLMQKMQERASEIIDSAAKDLGGELNVLRDRILKHPFQRSLEEYSRDGQKLVAERTEELNQGLAGALKEVWDDYLKTHQEYGRYKLKVFLRTTVGSVKILGTAALSGALAGLTMGLSLVIGIYGLAKTMSQQLQDLRDTARTAEEAMDKFVKILHEVDIRYKKSSKNWVGAHEAKNKLIQVFTTHERASISKCQKYLDLIKQKSNGLTVRAHKFATLLNEMLTKLDKYEAIVKLQEKAIEPHKGNPRIDPLKAELAKNEALVGKIGDELMKLIAAIHDLERRVQAMKGPIHYYEMVMHDMSSDVPRWSQLLQKGLPVIDFALTNSFISLGTKIVCYTADLASQTETVEKGIQTLVGKYQAASR